MKHYTYILFFSFFLLTSCAKSSSPQYGSESNEISSQEFKLELSAESIIIDNKTWEYLYARLEKDGVSSAKLKQYFTMLPSAPSQTPMGTKIKELYNITYNKKPQSTAKTPAKSPYYDYPTKAYKTPGPWYKNIVTKTNANLALNFINENAEAFETAEKEFDVPKELIAALMFVETRLGGYLGKENAFYSLASMSVSKDYSQIPDFTKNLPNNPSSKKSWINTKMEQRSEWAYDEFKALSIEIIENDLDPFDMPGSVYGAIGLCQFMPSNIKKFALDGNDDDKINLFDPPDAIVSVANYLKKHNWNSKATIDTKVKVLRKYNNSSIYSKTILALAETIVAEEKLSAKK